MSDKALGKNARCPSCSKVFVVAPAPVEPEDDEDYERASSSSGSTATISAAGRSDDYDPAEDSLSALADAAEASGYDRIGRVHERAQDHGSSVTRRARGEVRGTATGANASLILGTIGTVLSVTLLVLVILGAANVMEIGLGLLGGLFAGAVVTCLLCLLGVVQGGSARKRIRRARGTLEGAGQATTGIILGWVGLAIMLAAGIVLMVDVSKSGGIVIEEREIRAN